MNRVVEAATAEVQRRWSTKPVVALVLGTGLGPLALQVAADTLIPFQEIPGFAQTTAIAHRGQLVCGTLCGVPVVLLDGRCHFYEGYSFDEVTLPVRVVQACGASSLIITNASGGLNRHFSAGDVMVIEDHINLLGKAMQRRDSQLPNALRSPRPAPSPYDPQLAQLALEAARRNQSAVQQGVYAAVTGPNYETRSEYTFLRRIGADVVGMSTVPEVQVASQLGMRILGLSIVTNVAHVDAPEIVDAWNVVNAAEQAAPKVQHIVEDVVQTLRIGA